MLKRLIEVALPLKEVSEQSAREKSIRHGHISTLHIWWARRPLAACRAVVFASLIPDPDDPQCPEPFRELVNQLLPRIPNGDDSPRNRCLEFIKHLVKWENSNNQEIIGKARQLIGAAHKFLRPEAKAEMPKVLDPFAGGGAIPLEALRLGCEAHAIDLNPVAHLIELCTLVYPQKYGQPNSRPTPDYIKGLEAAHRGKAAKKQTQLRFGECRNANLPTEIDGIQLARLPLITEAEYQRNPLAADVKFWGHWVLEKARDEIGQFYPPGPDGSIPLAYLWARTVKCPNPSCAATIPLVRQLWLCNKPKRKSALRMTADAQTRLCQFHVVEGNDINFNPANGTVLQGDATCPFCHQSTNADYLRSECQAARMGQQLIAVVCSGNGSGGKVYRDSTRRESDMARAAETQLATLISLLGQDVIPNEPISKQQPRVMWVTRYGLTKWSHLFTARQSLALVTITSLVRQLPVHKYHSDVGAYDVAVRTMVSCALDKCVDFSSTLCRWGNDDEGVTGTFGRQALPMVWDFAESNPLQTRTGGIGWAVEFPVDAICHAAAASSETATVVRGDARSLPCLDESLDAVLTDPPYYDAVPYADLSDYFYVWLKRAIGDCYDGCFGTPLTPKRQEIIEERPHTSLAHRKDRSHYEEGMVLALAEMRRVLSRDGVGCVLFAHKTTTAWETLIAAITKSGMLVTSSWPIRTESRGRLIAQGTAALASSVTLVCRKRVASANESYWDDVRNELREVARERLDFFWRQGIRGADFFISAIGPALSVYGRYARVTRLTGEEVSVGQFLDEVRGIVTDYALSQILHGAKTGQIDSETRFYVLWKWSYADGKVPADEAFKLAQALGIDTESMWDRTGVLEKQGENVQALTVAKRMRINDLGEPNVDGSPAPLIDVLHRCCAFRDKGDTAGLSEYIARSGHGRNEKLWTVAQAISEVLPDGDKEKQLLQGLLNQRDKVEQDMKEGRLF
jgi:putative DNA methylase